MNLVSIIPLFIHSGKMVWVRGQQNLPWKEHAEHISWGYYIILQKIHSEHAETGKRELSIPTIPFIDSAETKKKD